MGYSHYWSHDSEIPGDTWVKIAVDAGRLAAAFPAKLSELQIDGKLQSFSTTALRQRILKLSG